jgi:geranylgeranyl diphosphate synthase type II
MRTGAAAEVGAAVELLHTAFVIHDDVIDGDDVRRGRLNVSGTFHASALASGATPEDASGFGRTAGILAGDLALTAAIRAVATCGAPPDVVHRLLDLFDAALHTTAAGELADVRLSLGPGTASLLESLAMEEQKTGAYSFALPLQAGAVLAGADPEVVASLGVAGRMLGIAFQLVDDLQGVFGDPARTGKSATSDLRTRKQTPLLTVARTTPEWDRIRPYVGCDLTEAELAEARRLLTRSGSRRFVEELVDAHLEAARGVVEQLGLPWDVLAAVTTLEALVPESDEVAA